MPYMNLVYGPDYLRSLVFRASDQCREGRSFNSCLGLRFFLCPTFVTCWSHHFPIIVAFLYNYASEMTCTRIQPRCVLTSLINPFFVPLLEQLTGQVNAAKDEGISVCSFWYCNWFNQCCFLGNRVLPFVLAKREKRRKKNRLEKLKKRKKKEAQIKKETASGI